MTGIMFLPVRFSEVGLRELDRGEGPGPDVSSRRLPSQARPERRAGGARGYRSHSRFLRTPYETRGLARIDQKA